MAEHEGWFAPGENGHNLGSRSYRNHNPGNLRSSPFARKIDGNFAVFTNDMIGWNAMQWDIIQKARGNTVTALDGKSTLAELIEVWAPRDDNNNPISYLLDVVARTGFKPTMKLAELLEM